MEQPRRRFLATTTGWAMIFCVLGVGSIFVPWAHLSSKFSGRFAAEHSGEIRLLERLHQDHSQNGLVSWHGIPTGILFVLLFLLLVATSPLDPVPLWRTIVLLVGGLLVVLFPSLFIERFVNHPLISVGAGAYFALILGFGLLFLGALEIRGMLLRRSARRGYLPALTPEIVPQVDMDEKVRQAIKPADDKERGL
jgi:hypothetical protein